MAKAASKNAKIKDLKASAEAKNWTKVIKAVRSPKTGAYTFKESIVYKDNVKEFLAAVLGLRIALITLVQFFASAEALRSLIFAFLEAAFAMII